MPQDDIAVAAAARAVGFGVLVGSGDEAHFRSVSQLGSPFSFRLDVEQMDGIATSVTDNHPTQNSSTSTRLSNNCSNKYRNIVFLFSN